MSGAQRRTKRDPLSRPNPWGMTAMIAVCGLGLLPEAGAGPYSPANGNNGGHLFADAPVAGFVGPDGVGLPRLSDGFGGFLNPNNYPNPLFFGWADSVVSYTRADGESSFSDPSLALGEVTGDLFDVVSLGELDQTAINNGDSPGSLTVEFSTPVKNLSGADFVVFENGFIALGFPGVAGELYAELAYVEVSANGVDFVRFDPVSLTPSPVTFLGTLDPTDLNNLAGKHQNSSEGSWGTPFDLDDVGLNQITHVRLVDIPGDGSFLDSGNRPIYDDWPTFGSGGADIEAVGVISREITFADWPQLQNIPDPADREPGDDPDQDGLSNFEEYAFARLPWAAEKSSPVRLNVVSTDSQWAAELTFLRDERVTDVRYDVWVSDNLSQWHLFGSSSAGNPFQPEPEFSTAEVSDFSASSTGSVGVLRHLRIRDIETTHTKPKRFFRVVVVPVSPAP